MRLATLLILNLAVIAGTVYLCIHFESLWGMLFMLFTPTTIRDQKGGQS